MEDKKTRQNNWLRLVCGLRNVREGLKTFVEVKSKDQHHHFASKVQQQCTNGQPVNCNKCIVNQNLLPASQAQPSSSKVRKTGNQRKRLCPLHGACSELYDLIVDNHSITNPRIHWKNTDSTKWWDQAVGHWEVTKCYFSSARYDAKMGPAEVDASGLLSLCIFSKYMQRHIAKIQNFEKVRDIRNTTLHAAHYEVDTQTASDCLDDMIAVLSDTKELHMDKDAQMACVTIQKLKTGSLQMSTDVLEYVNKCAEMKKNDDDAIREISDYVNQAKDEINAVKFDAVQILKTTTKEGVDLIKDRQYEAVNSVSDARIAAVDAVTAKQTEAIGKKDNFAMKEESERKRIEEENYLQKEKELRKILANFYEENHETLPLHPILKHKDSKLINFYQVPSMNIEHHLDENATRTKDSSNKGLERDRIESHNLCSFEDMFTQPQDKKDAENEISLSPGRWPSIVHHCTQAKEIWVQYHQLLPQFGLRLKEDTFRTETEFLSNFNNEFVIFGFVGLTPTKRSSISKMILNIISNDANLATIFDHAESRSRVFDNICSQNQIAPLVIISNVDKEKIAFLYADRYRYPIRPGKECVVVVVCENKQCNHNKRYWNGLIAYTCERNVPMIQKDISTLLKRWTYKTLAQKINAMKFLFDSMKDCQMPTSECIQQLRVHGIEKEDGAVQHINDRIRSVRKLKELLEESRALYSRNHIPLEDFQEFAPELRRPNGMMLKQISKSDYVIGCGDRFGTLLILIDEGVENRETIEKKLIAELKVFEFENGDVEFKYVSKGLRYFLKSGETIFANNDESYGTLAGFAIQDEDGTNGQGNVFALFSRHVAVCCSNSMLRVQDEIVGEVLQSDVGCIDIAAAKIYSKHVEACGNKFVTEENTEKTSVTFDPYAKGISLQGTLVHLVGAASEEIGLGKIAGTEFYQEHEQVMYSFLLENRVSNKHVFCEPGDSGAMILSYLPDDDKLLAIGMLIGSYQNKKHDKTDEFANTFQPNRKKHRAPYAEGEQYIAFYLKDGLNQLSQIHEKQFRLLGENKCEGASAFAAK